MNNIDKTKFAKRIFAVILIMFAIISVAYSLLNKPLTKSAKIIEDKSPLISTVTKVEPGKHHILVRYFHTKVRCSSCKKIEAYAVEAIQNGFPKELQDGRLVWNLVNIDEPGFKHFVQDFQLSTKSIVVTDENTQSPRPWKNLENIWEILDNKNAFISYIQQEIRIFIQGV